MIGIVSSKYRHLTCHKLAVYVFFVLASANLAMGGMADFEDLSLAPESYYNGADEAGGFTSGGAFFNNTFTDNGGGFTGWSGWSYSNVTDNTTPGHTNQYSAITGTGAGGSANYAVAFSFDPGNATIELPASQFADSILVTNTTYAYLAMRDGSQFSSVFGGPSGDAADFFLLTITGLDALDAPIGAVDFYLADYRFGDNSLDYLVDTWTEVDLTGLAGATTLSFGLTSSDVGEFGMNTPGYFAIDNLNVVPEPATLAMVALGGVLAFRRKRAH